MKNLNTHIIIVALLSNLCYCTSKSKPNYSSKQNMADTENDSGGFKYTSIENGNKSGHDSTTKYTRKDKPNALGYAKISIRQGNNYYEGVLDGNGKQLFPMDAQLLVNSIQDTIALVQEGRGSMFVNLKMQAADPAYYTKVKRYDSAEPYSCGLAKVNIQNDWFYININGEDAFNTSYDFVESFYADRALVKTGEKFSIIDTKGKVIATLPYDQVNTFSPYVWQVTRVRKDIFKSGFVNRDGKEVVPLIYDEVDDCDPEFNRGWVRIKNKIGFLDQYGKVVIPVKYESAEIFDKGKSYVTLDGRGFYIDVNGNEIK
ncbi:MAG: WG repeat-containing protein [Daejeonella sp.]